MALFLQRFFKQLARAIKPCITKQPFTMMPNLLDRLQLTSTCRLIRVVFFFTMALLFVLPIYDLFMGYFSYKLWTMLLVSISLFVYLYGLVCLVGKWSDRKQRMRIPSYYLVWIIVLIFACVVACYHDLFLITSTWKPYLFPLSISLIISILAIIGTLRTPVTIKKITKFLHL